MGPILVFGHRNPDNDSICSAVAYAHLKNLIDPDNVYVPARLGSVPRETVWAFERFGLSLPEEISHVHTRVRDVMTAEVVTADSNLPMLEAGRLMRARNVKSLPVVGPAGEFLGIVNQRMLAERYLEETEIVGFGRLPVTVGRLCRVLEGDLLAGETDTELGGRVRIAAAEPQTMQGTIEPGDALIVGDRLRTQPLAIEAGVACLIVTDGALPSADVVAQARDRGCALIATPHDTYSAARRVSLAHAASDLMETDVLRVSSDTLLAEAAEDLLSSRHREAVVLDAEGRTEGILTRTDVARGVRRRVVLVDHNEAAQSAFGIENADVVEIVDHHRVGDIETSGPILFLNLPVGSTATIVATRFDHYGVDIPVAIAGILLAALLTDTVILKSPTTTDVDRRMCARLAELVGVEPVEFGMEVFRSRSAGQAFSAETVVATDAKEYRAGDLVALIAQHETVDLAPLRSHLAEVRDAMEALRIRSGCDVVVLMATDIVAEGSDIIAVGKTRVVERALGVDLSSGVAWMPGVLSRKKQVAARIVSASS